MRSIGHKSWIPLILGLLLLVGCNDLAVFITPNPPSAVGRLTAVSLDNDGYLQLSWSTNNAGKSVKASIYLLELPATQTQYAFSDKSQFSAPLRTEAFSVPLDATPEKLGVLVDSPEALSTTLKRDLSSQSYYLIQNRR